MGLSRTVSKINSIFNLKSQNFPTSVCFASPLKGFPLTLGTGTGGQKTRMMGLPGGERSLSISSAVWIQYTNMMDRRMDRHRATGKTALMHIVQPPEGGTVQLRLHNIFLLFLTFGPSWSRLERVSPWHVWAIFIKLIFMLISSHQTNILNISVSTCPICLIKVSRPMFSRSGNILNTFTLLSG